MSEHQNPKHAPKDSVNTTQKKIQTQKTLDPKQNLVHEQSHFFTQDQTIDEGLKVDFDLDFETDIDPSSSGTSEHIAFPKQGVFEHLSQEVKNRLTQLGRILEYPIGAPLNSVGDPCQGLGLIIKGQVKVEWMDALGWEPIAMMNQGDVLGALEWAESKVWEERITACTPTSILFIPSHLLHSLIATYPDLQRQTERYTERHNLHTLLGVHPLFQGINDLDLIRLIDLASLRYVPAGKILFGPNMILALLFVVGRGEIELSIADRPIQMLRRGEIANLEFALGEVPQLLTARVTTDASLYVLPFDEVELMLKQASKLQLLRRQAHLLRARALNE